MAFEDQKQSEPLQVSVPTEIILEVFFRLPVVSLLRFKCVCKLWFSLISDPYFINHHVKANESSHHLRRLFLTTPETPIDIKTCHLGDVLHDKTVNALDIDYPFKDEDQYVWIVGSCNGLLCLRFWGDSTYCIWNPSTRRSSKRFSACGKRGLVDGFGFGYDESTDDYKVVELCYIDNGNKSDDTLTTHIYSLKSGDRKKFSQHFQDCLRHQVGTFSNGALHWLARKLQTDGRYLRSVVSFDLATESYDKISLPPYDEGFSVLKLGALGEWICLLCSYSEKDCGDLWVMKKYGVTNSWIKLFRIPYPAEFKRSWAVCFVPLCMLDDGRFLLHLRSKLFLFNPKNSSLLEIQSVDKWWHAIPFFESLVSPEALTVILTLNKT